MNHIQPGCTTTGALCPIAPAASLMLNATLVPRVVASVPRIPSTLWLIVQCIPPGAVVVHVNGLALIPSKVAMKAPLASGVRTLKA